MLHDATVAASASFDSRALAVQGCDWRWVKIGSNGSRGNHRWESRANVSPKSLFADHEFLWCALVRRSGAWEPAGCNSKRLKSLRRLLSALDDAGGFCCMPSTQYCEM